VAGLGLTEALLVAGFWLMVLAAAMTVLSGWAYLRAALPMLLGDDKAPPT
jgi:hypothetical protein